MIFKSKSTQLGTAVESHSTQDTCTFFFFFFFFGPRSEDMHILKCMTTQPYYYTALFSLAWRFREKVIKACGEDAEDCQNNSLVSILFYFLAEFYLPAPTLSQAAFEHLSLEEVCLIKLWEVKVVWKDLLSLACFSVVCYLKVVLSAFGSSKGKDGEGFRYPSDWSGG